MEYLDDGTYLYLGLIGLILVVFLWSRKTGKKRRKDQKDKTFKRRYEDRKNKK